MLIDDDNLAPDQTNDENPPPADAAAPVADATPPPPPVAEPPPWATKRIDRLTAEKYSLNETLAQKEAYIRELEARVSGGTPPADTVAPGKTTLTPVEIERMVEERAAKKAVEVATRERLQSVWTEGVKSHSDFSQAMQNYVKIGGYTDNFLLAAMETSDPAGVMYHLANNLDQAATVMELSPMKQAIELENIARGVAKAGAEDGGEEEVRSARAPAPIKPVAGRRTAPAPTLTDDRLSDDEWMALRNQDLAAKRKGGKYIQ